MPQSISGNLSTTELHPQILQVFWDYSALRLFILYPYYILCFVYGCIFLRMRTCVCGGQRTTFMSQPSSSARGCGDLRMSSFGSKHCQLLSHLAGPLLLNTVAVFFSLMPSPLETEFINFSERLHWFHNFPCVYWKVSYYALPGNV